MPNDTGLTRHHRRPRSLGGKSEKQNISRIPAKKHAAWHLLFQAYDPYQIAELINAVFLDPDFEFVVRPRN